MAKLVLQLQLLLLTLRIPWILRSWFKVWILSQPSEFHPSLPYISLTSEQSIVFIHGLRGHRRDTWTKDNVCWPQELLSKEEGLSHTRVLTMGYDANIVTVNGRASLNTLFQHSINLVQELSRVRRKDAVSRTPSSRKFI